MDQIIATYPRLKKNPHFDWILSTESWRSLLKFGVLKATQRKNKQTKAAVGLVLDTARAHEG